MGASTYSTIKGGPGYRANMVPGTGLAGTIRVGHIAGDGLCRRGQVGDLQGTCRMGRVELEDALVEADRARVRIVQARSHLIG